MRRFFTKLEEGADPRHSFFSLRHFKTNRVKLFRFYFCPFHHALLSFRLTLGEGFSWGLSLCLWRIAFEFNIFSLIPDPTPK